MRFRIQLIAWSLALIAVFCVFIGGSLMLDARIDAQIVKVAEHEKLVADAIRVQTLLGQLRNAQNDVAQYEAKIKNLLPDRDRILYLEQWMLGVTRPRQVDAKFTLVRSVPPAAGGAVPGFVNFQLFVRGPYQAVVATIRELESNRSNFLIAFDTLSLRTSAGSVQVTLDGRAFYQ